MKVRAIAAALTVGLAVTGGLVGASPASAAAVITVYKSGSPGPYIQYVGSGTSVCSAAPYGRAIQLNRQVVGRSPSYATWNQYVQMETTAYWSSDTVNWHKGFTRFQGQWVRPGNDYVPASFNMESFDLSPYSGYDWSVGVEFTWWVQTSTGWIKLGTLGDGFDALGIVTYGLVTKYTYTPTGEGFCYLP